MVLCGCPPVEKPASDAPTDGGCFSFVPDQLDFGEVTTGLSSVQTLLVKNHTDEAMLLRADPVVDAFRASPQGNPFVDPGSAKFFDVRFSPPDGRLHLAELEITGADRCRQRVALRGLGTGRVTAEPTTLLYDGVSLGESKALEVTLTNSRRAAVTLEFRIADDQSIRPGFTSPFSIDAPPRVELASLASITLRVTASPSYASTFNARLVATSETEELSVPMVMLAGTPVAELSRTDFDVPVVEFTPSAAMRRSFLERHFVVRNIGVEHGALPLGFLSPALEVEREDGGLATDEFRLLAPGAIGGGEEAIVTLRYLPTQFGTHRFRVLLRTNEVERPERVVTFTANNVTLPTCTGLSSPEQTVFTDANDGGSMGEVIFTNRGSTRCVLDDVHVRDAQFSVYQVLDGGIEQRELAPGESHSVLLAGPSVMGPKITGELNFHVLNSNSLNEMVRLVLPP